MARILDFKPRSRSRGFFLSSNLKGAGSGLTLPLSFLQRMLDAGRLPCFEVAHRQLGMLVLGLQQCRRLDRQFLAVAMGTHGAVDRDLTRASVAHVQLDQLPYATANSWCCLGA